VRVALNFDPGESGKVVATESCNLSQEPAAIERIEPAQRHAPLRSLLQNLNSAESPLATCGSKVWSAQEDRTNEPSVVASRLDLIFSRADMNAQPEAYGKLGQRLVALLGREKADALRAEVQVCAAEFRAAQQGYCLRLCLYAQGATPEQAQVRWGLGMARLQQALLFAARELKRELGVAS
jgi:hypothetical protein